MRVFQQLCYRVRTFIASSIPEANLRLPPNVASPSTRAPKRGLPTAEKLLERKQAQGQELPANLRMEDYVPPRELYASVSEADRNLVRMLTSLRWP